MPYLISALLFLALTAYGQGQQEQKRIAILPTVDDGDSPVEPTDLRYLTVTLREIAENVLQGKYEIMNEQSIINKLGKDNAAKKCKESEGCLAKLGQTIQADYIGQARLGRFDGNFTISVELYNSGNSIQVGIIRGDAKNVSGLLAVLNEKAPGMFRKMPGISSGSTTNASSIPGGIGGVQTIGGDYELNEKLYLVNLSTEPSDATLSFNGEPNSKCPKTPCKTELKEGSVRIIAVLDRYEKADTTVSIKQNNQSINIKLKPNFGVLEIKPAYLDGIGKDEQWNLFINNKASSSWENTLSPNKYKVELIHRCYDNIIFDAGINKGSREVFDMSAHIKLKKGGLVLSAERNGEPVSEPVYANGKQIGETPFSGTVPICATIELGKNREKVDVVLRHNEKVTHTVKRGGIIAVSSSSVASSASVSVVTYPAPIISSFKDTRDGKTYKTTKIGNQVWMAKNLNYNANDSKCYNNNEANCDKYGRLYNWNTAKNVCPSGWHLPSDEDWNVLWKLTYTGCDYRDSNCITAGKKLKAKSGWGGWQNSGNGLDIYGFSALPGGYGYSGDKFMSADGKGYWWSSSEDGWFNASVWEIDTFLTKGGATSMKKKDLHSVRCLQDN